MKRAGIFLWFQVGLREILLEEVSGLQWRIGSPTSASCMHVLPDPAPTVIFVTLKGCKVILRARSSLLFTSLFICSNTRFPTKDSYHLEVCRDYMCEKILGTWIKSLQARVSLLVSRSAIQAGQSACMAMKCPWEYDQMFRQRQRNRCSVPDWLVFQMTRVKRARFKGMPHWLHLCPRGMVSPQGATSKPMGHGSTHAQETYHKLTLYLEDVDL